MQKIFYEVIIFGCLQKFRKFVFIHVQVLINLHQDLTFKCGNR